MEPYLAKTVPPRLVEILPRERLFSLIDHLKTYPIILISSPAGSGKTTLVADYLKVTSSPALWYRADETDGDPASFFYGMREAAKNFRSRKIPLPLFTSDYQSGLMAFTKRYFEALFGRIGPNGVIVFDNYQDIPESSLLHEVVPRGLRLIHDGIKVFLISRKELPAQFVPLRAERILTSITRDHIRFTEKEMKKMIVRKQKLPASRTLVRRIYEQTQGWIAAIVLMLENDAVSPPTALIDKDSIFQYFSIEVFNRFEEGVRRFLLLTSILPTVSPQIAKRLTGLRESEEILADLSKNNYFTHLYADSYQYHPLFKEFLLSQARIRYSPEDFTAYTRRAGQLLSDYGDIENAVRLFLGVGAFTDAVPLILKNAHMLISHGRASTLENWMSKLPESVKENTPWLLYWLGMGYVLTKPTEPDYSWRGHLKCSRERAPLRGDCFRLPQSSKA